MRKLTGMGYDISRYFVRQIIDSLGVRERSFHKDIPMKEVKDRDEQFQCIAFIRKEAEAAGVPIISVDTKKKEMLGNFKRAGKALSNGPLKSLDHDFSTFSDGQIAPHGIYDVTRNIGYMTLGTSHDTSKFVCDNIARVWEEHLKWQYPEAHTIVVLCDGVAHYPPYCSKFNPIKHRLFSQVTRSWSGAPLVTLRNAAERAAMTTTKTGLKVYVHINSNTYEIKRPVDDSFQKNLDSQVVFAPKLGKWNYLVKPAN